jgi:outer membrane protein OmpA-like peptidoglycan-associated protein
MRGFILAVLLLVAPPAFAQSASPPVFAVPCSVFGEPSGAPYACTCDAAAPEGTVWGSGPYTSDSNVCTAARHAGIPPDGTMRITPMGAQPRFAGTTRNGITTNAYEAYPRSFAIAPVTLTGPVACPPALAGANDTTQAGLNLRCTCDAAATALAPDSVWGTDIYSSDSSLCRAAVHAGAIPASGGEILVAVQPGQAAFTGTRRNGVESRAYGAWPAAMSFPLAVATLPICPLDLTNRPMVAGPLTCLCPAEYAADTRTNHVWGTDTYTRDSLLCPAAVHYGAIPVTGGRITMLPRPAQSTFPGSRRNAVTSLAFAQPFDENFTFEGPPRGDVQPDVPVAAPIAQALKDHGTVALYIRFRTDSADLDASATPALEELRDALRAEPTLRLRLVGHTDNTGQAARNRTLSLQRAQSVQRWLVGQGIAAGRLAADGKGPDEPIADNATEGGRAVNRRTQAIRI